MCLHKEGEVPGETRAHRGSGENLSEQEHLAHELDNAVKSNEKYRSRARAVSTLCAAAAGALAAGLVLAPAEAVPKIAQVLGLACVTLLIVATGLSLAASSASSYQGDEKLCKRCLHWLEVWRIRTKPTSKRDGYTEFIEDARAIKSGIIRTLSWALRAAAAASFALIASLTAATFSQHSSTRVTIELDAPMELYNCPELGQIFAGDIQDSDRISSNTLLPVSVPASECGNTNGATLYLDKSAVAISS